MNAITKTLLCVALLSIVGVLAYRIDANFAVGSADGAQRAEPQKEHLDSDHEKREAALRKAMPGSVDIFSTSRRWKPTSR